MAQKRQSHFNDKSGPEWHKNAAKNQEIHQRALQMVEYNMTIPKRAEFQMSFKAAKRSKGAIRALRPILSPQQWKEIDQQLSQTPEQTPPKGIRKIRWKTTSSSSAPPTTTKNKSCSPTTSIADKSASETISEDEKQDENNGKALKKKKRQYLNYGEATKDDRDRDRKRKSIELPSKPMSSQSYGPPLKKFKSQDR